MVCFLRLRKDAVEVKQVQRKPIKVIKQLPDKRKHTNAGLFVMEKKKLRRGTAEYYKIMTAISRKLV